MLITLLLMGRQRIVTKIGKFSFIVLIAAAVTLPWLFFTYQQYASGTLETWFYSAQVGNDKRLAYSTRFPSPIFYLIEMVWPYPHVHPISLFVYVFTLLGLGFLLKRRKQEDKFLLIGFFVVYFIFTLITSKDWRYITLVFPILAVSGSEFILFLWDNAIKKLKVPYASISTKKRTKIAATVLVLLASASVIYSSWEAYVWIESDQAPVPIGNACRYVAKNSKLNETTVALFTSNLFSIDMITFYLETYDSGQRELLPYPEKPVDVYASIPNERMLFLCLNVLVKRLETLNVKYLVLVESGNELYFNSTLRSSDVLESMLYTERFVLEKEFGIFPRRVFIIRFVSSS